MKLLSNALSLVLAVAQLHCLCMQTIALLVLLGAPCWAQEAMGTWKLQGAKSWFHGPAPRPMTIRYEAHGEGEIWTTYQVQADGTSTTTSQTLHFDAKEYPCGDLGLEEKPDTVVASKLDLWTAEVSYKASGRVVRRILRTVSADGRQLTLDIASTPEKGPVVERRLVFSR